LARKQKSLAELRAENRLLRRGNVAASITKVLKTAIKYGALVLVFRYLYLMVLALSGKTTFASIVISFIGNLTVSKALAYIFGGGGVLYGLGERHVRRKAVKRHGNRIKHLESLIDPNRSSSNLTETGETPPEDHGDDDNDE
jgi:hypothetical protein